MSIPNKLLTEIGKYSGYSEPYIFLSRNDLDYYEIPDEILKIFGSLPHGSGIDGSWYLSFYKNTYVFHGEYHTMNECGYYDGWVYFKIVIKWPDWQKFKLTFNSGSHYLESKYMLREYLEEIIYFSIKEAMEGK